MSHIRVREKGHDVIEEADYTQQVRNVIKKFEEQTESKIHAISIHIEEVNKRKFEYCRTISSCKREY